jgi:hypothetical protein
MTQLLKWLDCLLNSTQSRSALETFILSKRPSSLTEIEFWAREYEQRSGSNK